MKFRNSYELESVGFRNYSYVSLITISTKNLLVVSFYWFSLWPHYWIIVELSSGVNSCWVFSSGKKN